MTANNALLVVKIGGGAGLDLGAVCDDLAQIAQGRPIVVVHGVSASMNQRCAEMGVAVETLTSPSGHSSRYTPPAVRDIYVDAAESENERLVAELRKRGVDVFGLVGERIALQGERKGAIRAQVNGRIRIIRDDYSGSIRAVDAARIQRFLAKAQVPVLPPMAASVDGPLNVDGDRAGAAVAGALNADTYVILSNVKGLYRDFPSEDSFVQAVHAAGLEEALRWAQGRMKRKVVAAREALEGGVRQVIIADGRELSPVTRALMGEGTRFTA